MQPAAGQSAVHLGVRPERSLTVLAIAEAPVYGGAEAFFSRVIADMASIPEVSVTCAIAEENERLRAEIGRLPQVGITPIPGLALRLAGLRLCDPARLRALRQRLADVRFDVAFLNMPSPEHGASLLLAFPKMAAPAVALMHIPHGPDEMGTRLGRVRSRLAPLATRRLSAICVLSPGAQTLATRRWAGRRTHVEVVPLPRPTIQRLDAGQARKYLNLPDGRIIGVVGRVSISQKGHDVFVDAARLLLESSETAQPLHFAVAGAGPDEERLRAMVRDRNMTPNFSFIGMVSPVDPFLSAVDVLAMPSRYEGVPLVALEAIAAGTPGVASSVPGLQDVWPGEWLVPRDNAAALASKLSEVMTTPTESRRRIMQKAAANAENYVTDTPAAALLKILRDVARRKDSSK